MKASGLPAGIEAIANGVETVIPGEFNGDVRSLPQVASAPRAEFKKQRPPNTKEAPQPARFQICQNSTPLAPMPSPIQNFAGLSLSTPVTGGTAGNGWPPDINGDVGPNHYIQGVNTAWGIYSKTGTLLAAFTENSLWSTGGIGTPCNANNQGDPVVVYDQFADRWYLTNFAFAAPGGNPVAPYYQCIAVSKTSDPVAGGWWLYAIR